jgi:hypothetical protein
MLTQSWGLGKDLGPLLQKSRISEFSPGQFVIKEVLLIQSDINLIVMLLK